MSWFINNNTATGGEGSSGLNEEQVIEIFNSLQSFAGISLPNPLTNLVSVTLPAANMDETLNIIHLDSATEGGEGLGESFTANSDGTITCNKDMFAVSVTCYVRAQYVTSSDAVLGIGIGDPLQIPNQPGLQVDENYVSRFQFSSYGRGRSKPITLLAPYEPVGKSTTDVSVYGIKSGDKIFPVMWTTDTELSVVVGITDLIFSVKEIGV